MLKKIIIGLLAGTITGLFGSGGGMILVPAFTYILKLRRKRSKSNVSILYITNGMYGIDFLF